MYCSTMPSEVSDTNSENYLLNYLSNMFIAAWSDERRLIAIADIDGRIINSSVYFCLSDYLKKGFKWSEEHMGMNALALAMKTGVLSYIFFEKHTNSQLKDHYTIAAPIYQENRTRLAYLLMAGKFEEEFELALTFIKFSINTVEQQLNDYLGYGQLLKGVSDAVIVLNSNEIIIYANEAASELIGAEIKENSERRLIGQPLSNFTNTKLELFSFVEQKKITKEIKIKDNPKACHLTALPQYDYHGVQLGTIIVLKKAKDDIKHKTDCQPFRGTYQMLDIVYQSMTMEETIQAAEMAARGPLPVLIQGESGTGKELFAHAIHNASDFSNGPFVIVDCSTIPRELVESELFGYAEGAFTGALRGGKIGKFQLANNGTIFLDEIGEMPLEIQTKLLRVLQGRHITKVGGSMPIPVNIRVIAATNKDLLQETKHRRFREDLFYRLNVIDLTIPPLRERPEDISLLANYFIQKYQPLFNKKNLVIQPEAMAVLCQYSWPGNVRELENVIARAVNLCSQQTIVCANLPQRLSQYQSETVLPANLYHSSDEVEKVNILKALKAHSGNKSEVAKGLKISRSTLYKKMKEYNIAD